MNESEESQWSASQHYDPMSAQVSENEFSNFLDLDLGDIEFPVFDTNAPSSREPSQQLNELPDGMHMHHANVSGFHSTQTLAANAHQQHVQQFRPTPNSAAQDHTSSFFDLSMPMYPGAQPQYGFQGEQHRFVPHSAIPPTPNSLEIHAGARFAHQQHMTQQQHMDPHNQTVYQLRKDDAASFTPLVSPAVTPREASFRAPQDFTVPGAYFSPLTSPALMAQKHRHMDHHTPGNSGSSAATSPADVDVDMLESVVQDTAKKTKSSATRKNLPRSAAAMSKIKQSPIHRARRKSRPSQAMTPKEIAMLKEAEATLSTGSRVRSFGPGLDVPRSSDGSEASISPEPLNESLMGPPPRPGSVSQSPALLAQRLAAQSIQNQGVAPATPASLMRLQGSPDGVSPSMRGTNQGSHMSQIPMLEDLILPEAVESELLNTSQDDVATPRVVPRKTPKLNPLMTPSGGAALSGRPSPSLSAITSPTTPIAMSPATGRRADPKGRNSKKRNSVSSTLPSPALRPKISPSIKPLLPDNAQGMTDDAHTLLLVTKSNYQNLLEGTHVPGVTYPEALSTNLTSKRTSHKIAEQGRRNRINNALQEMQALLASPISSNAVGSMLKAETKSPEGDPTSPGNGKITSAAAQANSKAATVELAIDYIKTLQREKTEQEEKMRDKDRELEELRKKMSEMETRLRASSETSSQGAT